MEKFTTLTGTAAPMPMVNVDTDKIIPKQFLKTITRTGLGKHLFEEMRFTPDGAEIPSFVLNKPSYRNAKIIIAGDNFGCGSSREHAPWALTDYGFRAVIAPSFADIFYNNCFKNGLLPIVLSELRVDQLFHEVNAFPGYKLTVDLERQLVVSPDGTTQVEFDVDAHRKYCLLNGLDDIGLSLRHADEIRAFEERRRAEQPWLFG